MLQDNAKNPDEVDKIREAAKQSISDHPERTEAVVLTIRSKDTQALAMMAITRDAAGGIIDVNPGELIFPDEAGNTMEGRFAAPRRPAA